MRDILHHLTALSGGILPTRKAPILSYYKRLTPKRVDLPLETDP